MTLLKLKATSQEMILSVLTLTHMSFIHDDITWKLVTGKYFKYFTSTWNVFFTTTLFKLKATSQKIITNHFEIKMYKHPSMWHVGACGPAETEQCGRQHTTKFPGSICSADNIEGSCSVLVVRQTVCMTGLGCVRLLWIRHNIFHFLDSVMMMVAVWEWMKIISMTSLSCKWRTDNSKLLTLTDTGIILRMHLLYNQYEESSKKHWNIQEAEYKHRRSSTDT